MLTLHDPVTVRLRGMLLACYGSSIQSDIIVIQVVLMLCLIECYGPFDNTNWHQMDQT